MGNIPGTWDLTPYDTSLLKESYDSKWVTHSKLKQDLHVLESVFAKQDKIKKGIKNMRKSLQSVNKDAGNMNFWETIAPGSSQAALDREVAEANKEFTCTDLQGSSYGAAKINNTSYRNKVIHPNTSRVLGYTIGCPHMSSRLNQM